MKYYLTTVPYSRPVSVTGDRAWIRMYKNEEEYALAKSQEKDISFIEITQREFVFIKKLIQNPYPLEYRNIKECYSLGI